VVCADLCLREEERENDRERDEERDSKRERERVNVNQRYKAYV
jgi:hypothetical protein